MSEQQIVDQIDSLVEKLRSVHTSSPNVHYRDLVNNVEEFYSYIERCVDDAKALYEDSKKDGLTATMLDCEGSLRAYLHLQAQFRVYFESTLDEVTSQHVKVVSQSDT